METMTDFILGGSKITADGDCSHEIKRHLLLGRKLWLNLVQFSSVQSLSHVRLFATPWIAACQASLSITNSWSSLRLMSRQDIKKQRHYFANKGLSSQSYVFSISLVWMWELDYKESWVLKNWCFWTVVLEKTLESSLDSKEIQPVHPKGSQSWIFIGRTDAEAETPILWPPDAKNWFLGKEPDAVKDGRQEEKGTTEDEMIGWHHWLNGYEFEQALGAGDGQGSLAYCSPWCCKESDMTEWLNWTKLNCLYLESGHGLKRCIWWPSWQNVFNLLIQFE